MRSLAFTFLAEDKCRKLGLLFFKIEVPLDKLVFIEQWSE
jgi:hypothetical protein